MPPLRPVFPLESLPPDEELFVLLRTAAATSAPFLRLLLLFLLVLTSYSGSAALPSTHERFLRLYLAYNNIHGFRDGRLDRMINISSFYGYILRPRPLDRGGVNENVRSENGNF